MVGPKANSLVALENDVNSPGINILVLNIYIFMYAWTFAYAHAHTHAHSFWGCVHGLNIMFRNLTLTSLILSI